MSIENRKFNTPETTKSEGTDELLKKEQEKKRSKAKERFYFDLFNDAVDLKDAEKEAHPERPESQVNDLQFYFKKRWDKFIEPLQIYEYEELRETIENNKDISNGERGRRLRALEERKRNSELIINQITPEKFNSYSEAQKRAWMDQVYRGMVKDLDRKERNRKYLEEQHPGTSFRPRFR
ncbi:MAG: hypothetical protein Q7R61_00920 [bacterium]|nr:hypothetical protein [bacterium]